MRTGFRLALSLLGLFNCLVNVTFGERREGSTCTIASSPGVCKKISDCASAWNRLVCDNVAPLHRDVCSFSKKEKVVCCPNGDPTVFTTNCVNVNITQRNAPVEAKMDAAYAFAKSNEMCAEFAGLVSLLHPVARREPSQRLDRAARSLDSIRDDSLDDEYPDYVIDPRITNGTRASASEFPHMAAVGFNETDTDIKWACGGTLISDQFVLTAGHCLRDRRSVASWVQLGSATLEADNPTNRYRVAERIAHPDYKPPALYNDIALLRLDSRVSFDLSVYPACLQRQRINAGLACTATGWGVTDWENPSMSNDLLKVLIHVQKMAQCNTAFSSLIRASRKLPEGIREESIICAGGGANDTCQGDSGGPIQVKQGDFKDLYSVIGVTSFGAKSCGNGSPALYSRVSHFVPWIVSVVWPPPATTPTPTTPPTRARTFKWIHTR